MDLSDYLDGLYACTSRDALDEVLIDTFEEIGATALSGYTFPYGGGVTTDKLPILSTWPDAVKSAYRRQMAGDDPIMYAAMTLGTPVHFLKLEASLDFNERGAAVINAMRQAGFQDGVTTPVYAKPGDFAYFVAAFPEERPDLTPSDLRRIKFLFSEYFYRYRELDTAGVGALSRRELQVLVAMVNDKSNSEIAQMLGVSEHTVGTYVRRCFEKLNVRSRTQAILRYIGAGTMKLPSVEP
ncbi:LuxR family transcriptional regulator [Henriciella sp.]|uniref:helix-turn-helix transcriptional regulator n=1 Tax=Henriciella sp. TaxID=1968823 RepID=UPI0026235BCF|nr:LuxR family transcriptional regulator [Henriciella sp.]